MTDTVTDVDRLANMVESELADTYDLIYVDYRDDLSDEQVGYLLAGEWESFYDSTTEWESDCQHEAAKYELDTLAGDIARREFGDEADVVLADFRYSGAWYEIVDMIRERDRSDWVSDLIRQTKAPLMRVMLDMPSAEADGNLPYGWIREHSNAALARELGCYTLDNTQAVTELAVELDWPEYLWAFLVFRPSDLEPLINAAADDIVLIKDPNIWLTNICQGNGHMVEVKGEYRVKRSDIQTDSDALGYSADEVMGLVYSAMDAEIEIESKAVAA